MSAVPVTTPAQVRSAIADRLRQLGCYGSIQEYDAELLEDLPCGRLLFAYIQTTEMELGPRIDVTWNWHLQVYVELYDWREAQQTLEQVCFQTLAAYRDDMTLDHLVEWWKINDTGEPPNYDKGIHLIRKSLLVQARIDDVGSFL